MQIRRWTYHSNFLFQSIHFSRGIHIRRLDPRWRLCISLSKEFFKLWKSGVLHSNFLGTNCKALLQKKGDAKCWEKNRLVKTKSFESDLTFSKLAIFVFAIVNFGTFSIASSKVCSISLDLTRKLISSSSPSWERMFCAKRVTPSQTSATSGEKGWKWLSSEAWRLNDLRAEANWETNFTTSSVASIQASKYSGVIPSSDKSIL